MVTGDPQAVTYSVGEVWQALSRAVHRTFPDEIWVTGEIRDLSRPQSGHVYFTLVEPDADGAAPGAQLRVVLFATDKMAVNRRLVGSGAGRMTEGVQVRIRGRVETHAPGGTVSLRMTWVDPDFTIGQFAAARSRLLRTLESEGLLARNRTLPIPEVPLRVALITSPGSAAEADFLTGLSNSGYEFRVTAIGTSVQGREAAASLVAALDLADALDLDVIALVRGGGSQTDLAAFDDERLARRIAAATKPVFAGIGHETDRAVADEVAAVSYKTPTECSFGIVSRVRRFTDALDALESSIGRGALQRSRLARAGIDRMSDRLRSAARGGLQRRDILLRQASDRAERAARVSLRRADLDLDHTHRRLVDAARRAPGRAMTGIDAAAAVVAAVDPARLFARGWSVTRNAEGRAVTTVDGLTAGELLFTRLADGSVTSRVEELEAAEERKDGGE